ncbi:MAG: hypothetical protein KA444_02775 [Bacteroidia bacterium]|nr:hypothetical protein [Bacteroidia bacterium]
MNGQKTSSYFSEGHPKRIFGFPEKMIYRFGVFLFYILLFFAVSLLSKKMPVSDNNTNVEFEKHSR